MAEVLGRADVVIRGDLSELTLDLDRAREMVEKFHDSIGKSGHKGTKPAADGFREAREEADLFTKSLIFVRDQLVGLGVIVGTIQLGHWADEWTDMRFRLNAATGSLQKADEVMQQLIRTSDRTFVSTETMVDAFNDTRTAMTEMGYSTQTQLKFLDSLNVALAASGARGERAARVQDALSRAIATGSLRSYTLNRILTDGDKVAEALAKKLGVTTLELRALGQQGKITAGVIVSAILEAREGLESLAEQLPPTMADSAAAVAQAMQTFIGTIDQALGISAHQARSTMNIASAIRSAAIPVATTLTAALKLADMWLNQFDLSIAKLMPIINTVFITLIGGVATLAVIGLSKILLSLLAPAFWAVVGAVRALGLALVTNPIILIGVALVGVGVAIWRFRDDVRKALGDDVVGIFRHVGNFIINSMRFSFEAIKFIWSNFPDIMMSFAVEVQNIFIALGNNITTSIVGAINTIIENINKVPVFLRLLGIPASTLGKLEAHTVEPVANPALDRLRNAGAGMDKILHDIMNSDSLGAFGALAAGVFTEVSNAIKATIDNVDDLSHAVDPRAKEAMRTMQMQAEQFIAQQKLAADSLGMTTTQAKALANAQQFLFQLESQQIDITPALRAQISAWGLEMAVAEVRTTRLTEAFNFAKESAKGFVSELSSGLRQGKDLFKSFIDAVMSLLNKLLDKLAEVAVEAAFANLSKVGQGGGGGFLGALATVVATAFHAGGVVGAGGTSRIVPAAAFTGARRMHSGGLVGLSSGEVPAILQRGERVLPRGAGNGGGIVRIVVQTVDSPYFDSRVDARSTGVAVQVVRDTDSAKARQQARTR